MGISRGNRGRFPPPIASATTRADAEALDAADPLAGFVHQFVVTDPDLCYLDGNSLGRLPKATVERVRAVVEHEWGDGLVRSWEKWIDRPEQVGDIVAPLIGVPPGDVVMADSTSVNLHTVVDAACAAAPDRDVLAVPEGDFPSDRYVVAGIAAARGMQVRWVPTDPVAGPDQEALAAACDRRTAVVVTSVVDFRSGALLDVPPLVEAAHRAGARVCLDLSHAAGAVPVRLAEHGVDLAVGCTYKYLCGGPGSPAYLYVRRDLQPQLRRPSWGWFGQREQFVMGFEYDPEPNIRRFLASSPGILGLAAAEEGARLVGEAGIDAIRAKSVALCQLVVDLFDERLASLGFTFASPRDPDQRGGHVTVAHVDAVRIGAAVRELANVIPDVRPPDRIRLGPAPLTTRFVEVWDGIDRLARLVAAGEHERFEGGASRVT